MFCEIGKGLSNTDVSLISIDLYHGNGITNRRIVYLYRILQFELMLSISGLVVALGALLTGVFGKKWSDYYYSVPLVHY